MSNERYIWRVPRLASTTAPIHGDENTSEECEFWLRGNRSSQLSSGQAAASRAFFISLLSRAVKYQATAPTRCYLNSSDFEVIQVCKISRLSVRALPFLRRKEPRVMYSVPHVSYSKPNQGNPAVPSMINLRGELRLPSHVQHTWTIKGAHV